MPQPEAVKKAVPEVPHRARLKRQNRPEEAAEADQPGAVCTIYLNRVAQADKKSSCATPALLTLRGK
ncbi:MAG: hypothetical protein D3926_13800 [Desulfobacteraceae bacterium]|nr:MAG: hypothetical protein D3926_13800 [Desulfobacteraceae bacterium]